MSSTVTRPHLFAQRYDQFFMDGCARENGCWSHARGRSFDSQDGAPGCARLLLKLIGGINGGRIFIVGRGILGVDLTANLRVDR